MDKPNWDELLIPGKGNLLTYVKRGVLWIQKEPYYIIDLVKEEKMSYVMVYKVHPGTDKNPQKLAEEVTVKKNIFSTTTRLGKLANAIIPVKTTVKWNVKPPVFIAPVLPVGKNTFTEIMEPGFYEREDDRLIVVAGEKRMMRGKNTGVFIGMSSIQWEDKMRISTESLVKTLLQYKKEVFYDLQGNNNDKDNPLATYYKEENK